MYHLMKKGAENDTEEEEDIDLTKIPSSTPSLLTSAINAQRQQYQNQQQQQSGSNSNNNVQPIHTRTTSITKNLPPLHTIDIKQELLDPIFNFYESKTNYDCMPNSGKVMVFDIDLPVRDAFQVAAVNDISFATLWDGQSSQLVGMLTVTDLIDILLHYHSETNVIQDLIAQKQIRYWRQLQNRSRPSQLIYVTPEDSLLTSIYTLEKYKIHRLPVISPRGSLLHIITHSLLLAYLVNNMQFDSPIFKYSLEALGIGTFENMITATPKMPLFDVLNLFAKYKVSAIPIVDDHNVVIDVFSRYDIVYLVRDGDYKLEITMEEALKKRPKIPVFTCTKNESFEKVLRHLASTRIHRLVCVDDNARVVGIVSISDIFSFLLYNDTRNRVADMDNIKEKLQRGPRLDHYNDEHLEEFSNTGMQFMLE
jgi:5'-AMP-activated protein kinase regulatory gamma subunit